MLSTECGTIQLTSECSSTLLEVFRVNVMTIHLSNSEVCSLLELSQQPSLLVRSQHKYCVTKEVGKKTLTIVMVGTQHLCPIHIWVVGQFLAVLYRSEFVCIGHTILTTVITDF